MKHKTLGSMIANLRKAKSLTQLELAEKMNVTDKAVSKWERNISCPDINSLPRLADILGVSIDELMRCKNQEATPSKTSLSNIINLVFRALALAMGVAVTVLSILKELEPNTAFTLLGIGLAALSISVLDNQK